MARPKVDIYFMADATGSMQTCVNVVKQKMVEEYQTFVTQMAAEYDTQVGVAWYRDVSDGPRKLFNNVLGLTNDTDDIQDAVNRLDPSGGGDIAEAQLLALYEVARTTFLSGWRPSSYRFIAWFGDQYGHDPVGYAGHQIDMNDTLTALLNQNITVTAFSMAPNNNLDGGGLNQATTITNRTGGKLVLNVTQDTNAVRKMYETIRGQLP